MWSKQVWHQVLTIQVLAASKCRILDVICCVQNGFNVVLLEDKPITTTVPDHIWQPLQQTQKSRQSVKWLMNDTWLHWIQQHLQLSSIVSRTRVLCWHSCVKGRGDISADIWPHWFTLVCGPLSHTFGLNRCTYNDLDFIVRAGRVISYCRVATLGSLQQAVVDAGCHQFST